MCASVVHHRRVEVPRIVAVVVRPAASEVTPEPFGINAVMLLEPVGGHAGNPASSSIAQSCGSITALASGHPTTRASRTRSAWPRAS